MSKRLAEWRLDNPGKAQRKKHTPLGAGEHELIMSQYAKKFLENTGNLGLMVTPVELLCTNLRRKNSYYAVGHCKESYTTPVLAQAVLVDKWWQSLFFFFYYSSQKFMFPKKTSSPPFTPTVKQKQRA